MHYEFCVYVVKVNAFTCQIFSTQQSAHNYYLFGHLNGGKVANTFETGATRPEKTKLKGCGFPFYLNLQQPKWTDLHHIGPVNASAGGV